MVRTFFGFIVKLLIFQKKTKQKKFNEIKLEPICAFQGPTQWHVQILMEKLLRTVNRTIIEMDPESPHIVSQQLSRSQTHARVLFHLERRRRDLHSISVSAASHLQLFALFFGRRANLYVWATQTSKSFLP